MFDALDLIRNKRELSLAAETSVAIGRMGAAGAAVTGIIDWSDGRLVTEYLQNSWGAFEIEHIL